MKIKIYHNLDTVLHELNRIEWSTRWRSQLAESEKTCRIVGQKPSTGVITRWRSRLADSEKTCRIVRQKPSTGVITRWRSQLAESEKTCRTVVEGMWPETGIIAGIREIIGRRLPLTRQLKTLIPIDSGNWVGVK